MVRRPCSGRAKDVVGPILDNRSPLCRQVRTGESGHSGQALEAGAGEHLGVVGACGGEDDGICGREVVAAASFCGGSRDVGVKGRDSALLSESDYVAGERVAEVAGESLVEFELYYCGNNPVAVFGEVLVERVGDG